MRQRKNLIVLASVAAGLALPLTGCKSDNEAPASQSAVSDQPKADHPKDEHPKGEHPK